VFNNGEGCSELSNNRCGDRLLNGGQSTLKAGRAQYAPAEVMMWREGGLTLSHFGCQKGQKSERHERGGRNKEQEREMRRMKERLRGSSGR
jgi:hypothetical protein